MQQLLAVVVEILTRKVAAGRSGAQELEDDDVAFQVPVERLLEAFVGAAY